MRAVTGGSQRTNRAPFALVAPFVPQGIHSAVDTGFVWLDGSLVPRSDARISAEDWGFLYGDTLFETVRVVSGKPLAWKEHMERWRKSARLLNYRFDVASEPVLDALRQTLAANRLTDAVARITLTRGRNPHGFRLRDCTDAKLIIAVRPFDAATEAQVQRGMRLRTVRVPEREGWPRYRTKSGNYLDFLLALDTAFDAGADEALLVDRRNRVLEGARSNFFLVTQDRLLTPPVRLGILPGVMRGLVIRWARREGITTSTRPILRQSLLRATEAFVTNSVWGIVPVLSIDGRALGPSVPGPVAQRLLARHDRWVRGG